MSITPPYTPLFDRVLDFAVRAEHEPEVARARGDYFSWTGEVFDEDRSFDVRMQGFLDWLVFDRVMEPYGAPAVRAYAATLPPAEAQPFRVMSRTVHGLFEVRVNLPGKFEVEDLLTAAEYTVLLPAPMAGVNPGDLFEGRLVPYAGRLHFSTAFLFHPAHLKRKLQREIRRQCREEPQALQELIWTMARMANRAEHYRNVSIDAIYDFGRPPPKVSSPPMRFDADSIAERRAQLLGRPSAGRTYGGW
jgi:hypothetical protein